MKRHLEKLHEKVRKLAAQSLVEYVVILALISAVIILGLKGIGRDLNNKLGSVNSNLAASSGGGGGGGGDHGGGRGGGDQGGGRGGGGDHGGGHGGGHN
jgi:Flp pilus assembly pilin Flp